MGTIRTYREMNNDIDDDGDGSDDDDDGADDDARDQNEMRKSHNVA